MIDFTGIEHGRLDKGGNVAIPGDPFACIYSDLERIACASALNHNSHAYLSLV